MSALFCRVLTQIFYQLVTIYSDNFIRIRSGFIAYLSNIDPLGKLGVNTRHGVISHNYHAISSLKAKQQHIMYIKN